MTTKKPRANITFTESVYEALQAEAAKRKRDTGKHHSISYTVNQLLEEALSARGYDVDLLPRRGTYDRDKDNE
jgi:hypothetical protein